jgi:hypothetical protein
LTLYSCIGHEQKEEAYITLYCLDSQINDIKKCIVSYFNINKVKCETDNIYWFPLKNNCKHRRFSWITNNRIENEL